MREAFLSFQGAMTCRDVAKILCVKPDWVRRKAHRGEIPRIPHMRFVRFDPKALADYFSEPQLVRKNTRGSLTIERHKRRSITTNGGYLECL